MRGTIREATNLACVTLAALQVIAGCGQDKSDGPAKQSDGPDGGIVAEGGGADAANLGLAIPQTDAPIGKVDSGAVDPGAAAAPLVPCTDDPSLLIWNRANYGCGTCGTDAFYPLMCVSGYLACAKSYGGSGGTTITVPGSMYVVNMADYQSHTGQCAYMASATYPSFGLADPQALTTARDPALPLKLKSGVSVYSQGFGAILTDRAVGEQVIRSLVVLTDMTAGAPVPYAIGDPARDAITYAESVTLTPVTPLLANRWYRVTVLPAEVQTLVKCHTLGRGISGWLTAPQSTDFYAYSRPMVGQMFVADKGGKGYIQFSFTEVLASTDLAANPMAMVAVDGVVQTGCLAPYACSGDANNVASELRLDMPVVPQSFTEISLRIPHTIKSVSGGTVLDGSIGNSAVTIDGDWAVYNFKASDMVLTDNNMVKRWYYVGP